MATLDTLAMHPDLKVHVRIDLEGFLKGHAYYLHLGRVWRRSYLIYGPPGISKSTFSVAMARFIGYDVDLSHSGYDDNLRSLIAAQHHPVLAHPHRRPRPVPPRQ
jgi:mitochondrial chaperone BCS1